MLQKLFFAALAALVFSSNANAAYVSINVATSGNTWQLYARSSLGDDGGIASFNIPMLNVLTMTNESPFRQLTSTNFNTTGFSQLRNPATDADPVGKTLGASQKLVPSATPDVVYGFGQTGGTLPGAPGLGASRQTTDGAQLLLGTGPWSGSGPLPFPDFNAPNMSIVVFNQSGQTAVSSATVIPACLGCRPNLVASPIDNVIANDPGMVTGRIANATTVDVDSWHDFMFQSYTPGFGGSGSGPAVPAEFDPATQVFSWTTIGSAPGTYRWSVAATNVYGTGTGTFTVRIVAVPEPQTMSLVSMAVVGFSTRRRRRA